MSLPAPSPRPDMSFTARPLRLSTADSDFDAALAARLQWSADTDAQVEDAVAGILDDVRRRGDAAVLAYTNQFDMAATSVAALELKPSELEAAYRQLPARQRDALQAA